MPIENRWYIPRKVLHRRFYGKVTLDEIQDNITEAHSMVESGIPLVHTLDDVQDVTAYPNLTDLTKGIKSIKSDKEGWHIIVGAKDITRFIGSVVIQLTDKRYQMIDTIDEALAFLAEQDEAIDLTQGER